MMENPCTSHVQSPGTSLRSLERGGQIVFIPVESAAKFKQNVSEGAHVKLDIKVGQQVYSGYFSVVSDIENCDLLLGTDFLNKIEMLPAVLAKALEKVDIRKLVLPHVHDQNSDFC